MIRGGHPSSASSERPDPSPPEQLPYAVELWNLSRTAPERVIARAASLTLARAIFVAAAGEHPGRKVVLRRGAQALQESG
jgi:hypothetical protein